MKHLLLISAAAIGLTVIVALTPRPAPPAPETHKTPAGTTPSSTAKVVFFDDFNTEADWVSAAVHGPHYSGETPFVNRYYFPSGHDVQQWHTYTVDWTPDSLLFSYDGNTMFRLTRAMATHYGPWAFDQKQFLILNFGLGGGYPAKINGLTKPYYGLSQSTLDLIKQHKAKMLVDWVKVTQYPTSSR